MNEEDIAFASLFGDRERESFSQSSNGESSSQSSNGENSSQPGVTKQPDEIVKTKVRGLLSQNSDRLTFLPKVIKDMSKEKSDVWPRFKEALIDGERVGIFKCNSCTALYIYKAETGTSSMKRHTCDKKQVKQNSSGQPSMQKFCKRHIPDDVISKLNRDITMGLAKDLQPLRRAETEEFLYIAQKLIDFGAQWGHQTAADVIQHRTTMKRVHLVSICDELSEDIKTSLINAPSYPIFPISKDMWCDKHQSQDYLSMTAHFIDDDWFKQKAMLGMEACKTKKDTDNVRDLCNTTLVKYFGKDQLDTIAENLISVTDGGSNMVNLFPNRLPCQCHNINLCGEWTFNEKPVPTADQIANKAKKGKVYSPKKLFNLMEKCPQIHASIVGIKELTKYFKKSKLNSQLPSTLKQEVCTRFNSLYFPLDSYYRTKDEVKAVLLKNDNLDLVMHINDGIVKELIDFIQPFKEESELNF